MATPPKDSPSDHEANLFIGSSSKARELFKEAKRVRRLTERKLWWNSRQPSAADQTRGVNNLEE